MSCFRVCPTADPHVTRMEFDYFHLESGENFEEYFKFVRQVAMEDFELCEKTQSNLAKGVYHEGILNPNKENGVSCELWLPNLVRAIMLIHIFLSDYQRRVFDMVCEQHESDRTSKIAKESGIEEHVAPTMVQMAA